MQSHARQHRVVAAAARTQSGQPAPEPQPSTRRAGLRARAPATQGGVVGGGRGRRGWRARRGSSRAA